MWHRNSILPQSATLQDLGKSLKLSGKKSYLVLFPFQVETWWTALGNAAWRESVTRDQNSVIHYCNSFVAGPFSIRARLIEFYSRKCLAWTSNLFYYLDGV